MEALILLGGVLFLTISALLYVYLIETKKISVHIPPRYKQMQIELQKIRGGKNDTVS